MMSQESQRATRLGSVPLQRRQKGATPWLSLLLYRPHGWSVLEAVGELDANSIGSLRSLLAAAGPNVVVDLHRVTFMDASGLGVLATSAHRARRDGGAVRLVAPSRQVRRILTLTRLLDLLPTFDTMQEALADGPARQAAVPV